MFDGGVSEGFLYGVEFCAESGVDACCFCGPEEECAAGV